MTGRPTTADEVLAVFRKSTLAEQIRANMHRRVDPGTPIERLEPESLELVELVMEAEAAFGVEVPDEAFSHAANVGELAEAVAASINAGGRAAVERAPHRFERRA